MDVKISVVITSYNQPAYLREAIESVLCQTLRPFEIIVCDDASTDGSQELIMSYERQNPGLVKGVFHRRNMGIALNRTSGLDAVGGDYVSWLDGDDRYKPRKLEEEAKAFKRDPEVRWVYSQVDVIDENGERLRARYENPPEGYIFDEVVGMLGGAPRNQLIHCESLRAIGFFKPNLKLYEDFELCLRMAKHYKAAYCPEALVEYRVHGSGLHKRPKEEHIDSFVKLFEHLEDMISDLPHDRQSDLKDRLADRIEMLTGERIDVLKRREAKFY